MWDDRFDTCTLLKSISKFRLVEVDLGRDPTVTAVAQGCRRIE